VVDDDDAIRSLVSETLRDEGYRTVEADNGRAALEVVRDGAAPRLILLDMRMPIMNGWEFAEAYRQLDIPRAPIVVVTAGRDAAAKASDISADAYIGKPFELDALLALVERFVKI
jgi:two-component system chemotaxis response regulator CheY